MERIKCPQCQSILSSQNTLPRDKVLVCSKCSYKGLYASFQPIQNGLQNDLPDAPTMIVNKSVNDALAKGHLKLTKSTIVFFLKDGENRVGRKVDDSKCEHKVENGDTHLSRLHFTVNVVFNKVALCFDHQLIDNGSKNGTFLNNEKVNKGDILLLTQGDTIRAGKTEFEFELPDDGATIVL